MARLFTADLGPGPKQLIKHIFVAHRRSDQLNAAAAQGDLESDIAHHGSDDFARLQLASVVYPFPEYPEHSVAIDDHSLFVDKQRTVSVPVEGHTEVSVVVDHFFPKMLKMQRPAVLIYISSVGPAVYRDNIGTERPK